eukprot:2584646-Heterocapsa_arctica.AAC.1
MPSARKAIRIAAGRLNAKRRKRRAEQAIMGKRMKGIILKRSAMSELEAISKRSGVFQGAF